MQNPFRCCTVSTLQSPVKRCASAVLQNPVNTMAFTMVQMLLTAPLVTVVRNGTTFCVSPLQTKPFLFLTLLHFSLVTLLIACRPAVHANLFRLCTFRSSFRWQFELLALATIVFFSVVMHMLRSVLFIYIKRRTQPAIPTAASLSADG